MHVNLLHWQKCIIQCQSQFLSLPSHPSPLKSSLILQSPPSCSSHYQSPLQWSLSFRKGFASVTSSSSLNISPPYCGSQSSFSQSQFWNSSHEHYQEQPTFSVFPCCSQSLSFLQDPCFFPATPSSSQSWTSPSAAILLCWRQLHWYPLATSDSPLQSWARSISIGSMLHF